jgi:N-acetylglucosaminyl-diphospho-decaprenol L-rhamnosyltransferase
MTEPLPVAAVVVSFNTAELLERCLHSVMDAHPAEVIVVDNGSTDGSVAMAQERFPQVRLITPETNRGYGAAANHGVAASSAPAILLLNSDTTIEPDAPGSLGGYLAEHPTVAVAGPRLLNPDGSLQRSARPYPSVGDTLLAETGLHLVVRRLPGIRERFFRTWSHDLPQRVPWVLGAALAIRRSAFEAVGGFDTGFFMYGEESDLCRRLERAGYEIHYAPVTSVVHIGAASTRSRADAMRRERLVGHKRYLLRHSTRASAERILAVLRVIDFVRMVRDTLASRVVRDPARRTALRETIASRREPAHRPGHSVCAFSRQPARVPAGSSRAGPGTRAP